MNVHAAAEQASGWRKWLEGYGRARALMAMAGSAILLVLDVPALIQ